ncbi:MAG: hypothetical protein P1U37_12710 [Minwuia sp.]|nr:hypothetical protein [Minwuia sp.]
MNRRSPMRQALALLLAGWVMSAGAALAQALIPTVKTYQACTEAVDRDPETGMTAALQWRDLGGGRAAEHCVALALAANGNTRLAAARMQDLAEAFGVARPDMAATIMSQAAALWVLAREDARALTALDRALEWQGSDALLHLDRAHVLAGLERFDEARKAADMALSIDDLSAEAYALRAMINRRTGRTAAAETDIVTALALQPDQPQALVERARSRANAGDIRGAREDLLSVIAQDDEAAVAEDARRLLEQLDVVISD